MRPDRAAHTRSTHLPVIPALPSAIQGAPSLPWAEDAPAVCRDLWRGQMRALAEGAETIDRLADIFGVRPLPRIP
jgi:hypothetical protein